MEAPSTTIAGAGPLAGKLAVVTGGSRGIGAAIATRLALDGATVVVNHCRPRSADAVVAAIAAAGGQAIAVQGDVAKSEDVKALFAGLPAAPHIVVHNAAVASEGKTIAECSDAEFAAVIDCDLTGAFYVLREAANRVVDGGSIIVIGSSVTLSPWPRTGAYSAAKAALEALTKVLAAELGAAGRMVTVNNVAPGAVATDMLLNSCPPEAVESMAKDCALRRIAQPEDIAGIVAALVGPGCRWLDGITIHAHGGYFPGLSMASQIIDKMAAAAAAAKKAGGCLSTEAAAGAATAGPAGEALPVAPEPTGPEPTA